KGLGREVSGVNRGNRRGKYGGKSVRQKLSLCRKEPCKGEGQREFGPLAFVVGGGLPLTARKGGGGSPTSNKPTRSTRERDIMTRIAITRSWAYFYLEGLL